MQEQGSTESHVSPCNYQEGQGAKRMYRHPGGPTWRAREGRIDSACRWGEGVLVLMLEAQATLQVY